MAGTAAGIAKANEARLRRAEEKRIARRFEERFPAQSASTANEQPTTVNDGSTGTSNDVVAVVGSLEGQSAGNQQLAPYVPGALDLIGRIIRGTVRAPAAVRANVALRVVEMSREDARNGGADTPEAATLAMLAGALALRRRTVEAVTVQPIPGGDSVAEPEPGQS